jgi:hypothetical protein
MPEESYSSSRHTDSLPYVDDSLKPVRQTEREMCKLYNTSTVLLRNRAIFSMGAAHALTGLHLLLAIQLWLHAMCE